MWWEGSSPTRPRSPNTLPSRSPEEFVIERFFREARSPYARFSYVVEGSLRQLAPEPFEASIAESVFVHGDDWLSRATYAIDGEELKESLAVVDGTVYVQASADAERLIGDLRGCSSGEPVLPDCRRRRGRLRRFRDG
ncbi:hypothetical protein BH20CHL8_BH20CHL8_05740 [soil metagenome]